MKIMAMKIKLRQYQEDGVNNIRLSYMQGNRAVLYVLPTGGGKTVIFSHISEQAAIKGNRVCILVHRTELVDQSSDSLNKIGVEHGVITAGKELDLSKTVQVASVFTLVRRLHLIPEDFFGLLVVDEAHHAVAGSWKKVIDYFHKAKVLGVTATPERLDGKGLGNYFQSMILGEDTAWLTANNYLAPTKVFAPPNKLDRKALGKRGGDFKMEDAQEQMQQGGIMGDAVTHYQKHIHPLTAIAFCCTIAHAKAVSKAFTDAGISSTPLTGDNCKDRKDIIKKLGTGEIKVVTSCQIISEGTDVPTVGGAILLRPTQSLSLYLQQVGRCLRPAKGKQYAIINDHVGNSITHGLPNQPREWSLEGKKVREKVKAPPLKVCDVCFAVNPIAATECIDCGHVFKVKETRELKRIQGDLIERTLNVGDYVQALENLKWVAGYKIIHVSKEKSGIYYGIKNKQGVTRLLVHQNFVRPPLNKELKNCKTYDDLKSLAASRGYKQGWAYYKWQARQSNRFY